MERKLEKELMSNRYTAEDLLSKIEWEGGVAEAMDYGITWHDVPLEISGRWYEANQLLDQFNVIADSIQYTLERESGVI